MKTKLSLEEKIKLELQDITKSNIKINKICSKTSSLSSKIKENNVEFSIYNEYDYLQTQYIECENDLLRYIESLEWSCLNSELINNMNYNYSNNNNSNNNIHKESKSISNRIKAFNSNINKYMLNNSNKINNFKKNTSSTKLIQNKLYICKNTSNANNNNLKNSKEVNSYLFLIEEYKSLKNLLINYEENTDKITKDELIKDYKKYSPNVIDHNELFNNNIKLILISSFDIFNITQTNNINLEIFELYNFKTKFIKSLYDDYLNNVEKIKVDKIVTSKDLQSISKLDHAASCRNIIDNILFKYNLDQLYYLDFIQELNKKYSFKNIITCKIALFNYEKELGYSYNMLKCIIDENELEQAKLQAINIEKLAIIKYNKLLSEIINNIYNKLNLFISDKNAFKLIDYFKINEFTAIHKNCSKLNKNKRKNINNSIDLLSSNSLSISHIDNLVYLYSFSDYNNKNLFNMNINKAIKRDYYTEFPFNNQTCKKDVFSLYIDFLNSLYELNNKKASLKEKLNTEINEIFIEYVSTLKHFIDNFKNKISKEISVYESDITRIEMDNLNNMYKIQLEKKKELEQIKQNKMALINDIKLNKIKLEKEQYYNKIKTETNAYKEIKYNEKLIKIKEENQLKQEIYDNNLKLIKEKLPFIKVRQDKANNLYINNMSKKDEVIKDQLEKQNKLNNIIENLKCRPIVESNPLRILDHTLNVKQKQLQKKENILDNDEKAKIFNNVNGFTSKELFKDYRYKLQTYINEHGIEYNKAAVNEVFNKLNKNIIKNNII